MTTFNEDQLLKLKQNLPELWDVTISKKLKCSRTFVRLVFKNKAKNIDLIDKVISEALKLKSKQDAKIEKVNQKLVAIA
jgi:hypothetical protein